MEKIDNNEYAASCCLNNLGEKPQGFWYNKKKYPSTGATIYTIQFPSPQNLTLELRFLLLDLDLAIFLHFIFLFEGQGDNIGEN